ncbi:zinc-ribbon domain-containing protein [Butyrivibrio sp. WCD2001]|uniref:zinc-ribbon domain-containing protein n=1 Tax=Butyrivibrio sp. WCD2001 TaxID=1280681 RepID=UPI00047B09DD|nr:zinc-ribbon domain-containing protein [Butyrivibrio sp. WCD2001]
MSKVIKGKNDLATTNPTLACEWHPVKNGNMNPTDVTAGSGKKVWWLLSYDDPSTGKHFDFEWEASISDRNSGSGCPFLASNPRVWRGFNDLATVDPALALEWNYEKNYPLTPCDITSGSSKRVWWKCNTCGFEWAISVANRKQGWGKCAKCKKHSQV